VKELPEFIKNSIEAYVGCLSGAIMKDRYIRLNFDSCKIKILYL